MSNSSKPIRERPVTLYSTEDSTSLSLLRHHNRLPAAFETGAFETAARDVADLEVAACETTTSQTAAVGTTHGKLAAELASGSRLNTTTLAPLAGLLVLAAFVAGGWEPSLTFQPTLVGILWAGAFLGGYLMGGDGRGRLATLWLVTPLGYSTWRAFFALTDLAPADSLLLVVLLMVGGWGAARLIESSRPQQGHFSIWDIGFVTTIVACAVRAGSRLEAAPVLQFAVAACLVSGLLCSWGACAWAWKDNWNARSLSALVGVLVGGTGCVFMTAPAGWTLIRWLQWALAGPVNVIAAQATVVLAVLTLWRWGHDRLISEQRLRKF